ncbi:MAG: sigma-70 family RNA polymerase sigma factor [Planctomycetes bacterium]|nr:sigma-70 family RNA polymerase sigma factor [Planctomycetota bacterium]
MGSSPDGIDRLLIEHRQRLHQWVEKRLDRRLRGRVDASDVVQDVCLEAAERLRRLDSTPEIGFFGWLRSLAHDRLIDLHRFHVRTRARSLRREAGSVGTAGVPDSAFAADESTPSRTAIRGERDTLLHQALARLRGADRMVIELREFAGATNVEVAAALGLSEAAASARYVRALERLGAILRAEASG